MDTLRELRKVCLRGREGGREGSREGGREGGREGDGK
jgi:hypothetical protein